MSPKAPNIRAKYVPSVRRLRRRFIEGVALRRVTPQACGLRLTLRYIVGHLRRRCGLFVAFGDGLIRSRDVGLRSLRSLTLRYIVGRLR
jgi:hypothetical protein